MLIKSYGLKGIIKSKKLSDNKVIVIQDQYERYRKMPISPVTKYKVVALLKIRNPVSLLAKYTIIGDYDVDSKLEALYHFNRIAKIYERDKTEGARTHR